MATTTNTPKTRKPGRGESVVQIFIMLAVAGMAGAASFTHVHDWTMHNSPAGTGSWFGWANAMVSELIPLAAGLETRRRIRHFGTAGKYPIALIIGAVALSLTGQFAEAKHSVSGWLIAAVPALGFLALVKLVLSSPATPAETPADDTTSEITPEVTEPATDIPAEQPPAFSTPAEIPPVDANPVDVIAEPVEPSSSPAPSTAIIPAVRIDPIPAPVAVPSHLLAAARFAATQHAHSTGQTITAPELAARMNLTFDMAGALLDELAAENTITVNGHDLTVGA